MEKDVIFKGAGVAIATPFYENGNGINYDELARLIDFNLNNGTDAIIIAGTSGESATMTDEEHEEIIIHNNACFVDSIDGSDGFYHSIKS